MTSRYQYIVTYLTLRDAIAVNLLALTGVLLSPLAAARWLPPFARRIHIGLVGVFVYGLFVAGVIHDLTNPG